MTQPCRAGSWRPTHALPWSAANATAFAAERSAVVPCLCAARPEIIGIVACVQAMTWSGNRSRNGPLPTREARHRTTKSCSSNEGGKRVQVSAPRWLPLLRSSTESSTGVVKYKTLGQATKFLSSPVAWAAPGIEPGTSRTLSENYATRPSSHDVKPASAV